MPARIARALTLQERARHTANGERLAALLYAGIAGMIDEQGRGAIARHDRDWFTKLGGNITSVPLTFRALSVALSLPDTGGAFERHVLHPMVDEITVWRGWPSVELGVAWDRETTTQAAADIAVRRAATTGSLGDIKAAYLATDAHLNAGADVRRVLWFMQRVAINSLVDA